MGRELRAPEKVIYVCKGSTCKSRGSNRLRKILKTKIKENKLKNLEIIKTECTDRCKWGPVFCLQPQNLWFYEVDEQKLLEIFTNL